MTSPRPSRVPRPRRRRLTAGLIAAAMATGVLIPAIVAPAPASAATSTVRYLTEDMNLRQGPTTGSKSLMVLKRNARVTLQQSAPDENGWIKIQAWTTLGYVKSKYLVLKPVAPPKTNLPFGLTKTYGAPQMIVAYPTSAKSSSGTLEWWSWTSTGWKRQGSTPARFGSKGVSANRTEGDYTTPVGVFAMPFAFGTNAKPATKMTYKHADNSAWWCEDYRSPKYNTWQTNMSGCSKTVSEHIASYPQYRLAMVIAFNYGKPVPKKGSGIFLHVNGAGSTAGCVSVSLAAMTSILKWADPKSAPHIAIDTTAGFKSL